jgi:hypothetical protein
MIKLIPAEKRKDIIRYYSEHPEELEKLKDENPALYKAIKIAIEHPKKEARRREVREKFGEEITKMLEEKIKK